MPPLYNADILAQCKPPLPTYPPPFPCALYLGIESMPCIPQFTQSG